MKLIHRLIAVLALFAAGSAFAGEQGLLPPAHFLQINGINVAYYETDGHRGPGILLVHGNSVSAKIWTHQLMGGIGHEFRIVALDLPGCGASSNAADPSTAYPPMDLAQLLATFVHERHLDEGILIGQSLGGDFVMEASTLLPALKGMIIVDSAPAAKPLASNMFLPNPAATLGFVPNLTPAQVTEYVDSFFRPNATDIPQFFYQDVSRTDPQLRGTLGASVESGAYLDETAIVKSLKIPFGIIYGTEDQLYNVAYVQSLTIPTLWENQVHFVSNAGHEPQFENPEAFDRYLRAFVRDIK